MANITNGTVTVQLSGGVGPYQFTLLNAGNNLPVPSNAYPTFTNPVNNVNSDIFTFGNANDATGNSGLQPGSYRIKIVDANLCEIMSNVLVVSEAVPNPTATPVPVPTATPAPTAEPTATPEPTATEVPPTATPEPTLEPTATEVPDPTATPVPDPTATEVPDPTATPVPEPTATEVPDPTATEVPDPTATPVPEPTATEVPDPTATPVPEPTATEVPDPTATPVPEPTATEVPDPTATPVPEPTATEVPDPTATPEPTAIPLSLQPQRKVVTGWNLMAGEPEEFINGLLDKTEEEHREFFCNAPYISGVSHQSGDEARPYVLWTDQDESFTMPEVGNVFYADQQGTQYFTNSGFLWWNSGSPTSEETNYYWVTIGTDGIAISVERWTECIPDPTATPVPEPTATEVPAPTATPVPAPTATEVPDPTATPVPEPTSNLNNLAKIHLGIGGYPYAQDLINGTLYKSDNSVAESFGDLIVDVVNNPEAYDYDPSSTVDSWEEGVTNFDIPASTDANFFWLIIPDSAGVPDLTQNAKISIDGAPDDVASEKLAFTYDGAGYVLYKLNTVPTTAGINISYN